MMRHGDFRGATSGRMTALQFPSSSDDRESWTAEKRAAEIEPWAAIAGAAEGQHRVGNLVAAGDQVALVDYLLTILDMQSPIE
jgi:hypothetical protein